MRLRVVLITALCLSLAACAGSPTGGRRGDTSGYASGAGQYKIGKPYSIEGQRYTPREDFNYEESGIASWYGPGFAGKRTANGEVFDPTELTAAHRTLPMPSLVRVTNLDNGRSVVARVNDRGPFAAGRIIDMSQRGAELLGFQGAGTAKVKVEILATESKAIANAAKKRYKAEGVQMAELSPRPSNLDEPAPEIRPVSDEEQSNTPAPIAAPLGAVEAVPLEGPVPPSAEQPIGTPSENVIQSAELAPTIPDPKPATVAGKVDKGIFYPEQKVQQMKVGAAKRIFVQAGAFSVKENAVALQQKLSALGPSSISEADVNGVHFFRVRVGPIENVSKADDILAKVLGGSNKAKITVE